MNMERTPIAILKGPTGASGPRGLPGVNAVANDDATAGQIAALDSATRGALGAVISGVRTHNINPVTLARARAAIARAMSGGDPLKMHFLGHSYLTGLQTAPPYPTNTSPMQVMRMLDASGRFGRVREGYRVLTYGTALGANISDDPRFTQIDPEWVFGNSYGYAGLSSYTNNSGTGMIEYSPGVMQNMMEFIYMDGPGTVPLSFSLNGSTPSSSAITGGATTPIWKSRQTPVTRNATHRIGIHAPATGRARLLAFRAWDTTEPATIEVTNGGVSGSSVNSWNGDTAGYLGSVPTLDFFKPELALIMLGINDRSGGRPEVDYLDGMRTLAQRVQSNGGDVIFLREPMPSNDAYTLGLYGLCDELGAGLIETGLEWPKPYAASKAEPFGYIGVDDGHPSPRGHTAIARAVADVLIGAL